MTTAMYNRYRGNGSRAEKIEEPKHINTPPPKKSAAPPKKNPPHRANGQPLSKLPLLGGTLSALPQKLGELETEDLLLILILYLMYRESGDKELLIIMGAMYLL